MSRPSGLEHLWLPAQLSDQNILTSVLLDEGPNGDRVELFVSGDPVAEFTLPAGVGARVLTELGLERQGAGNAATVPLVVAQLLGRLGQNVSIDEITYLAREARAEPELSLDHLELTLLSRRAIQSRARGDVDLFNAALNRQSEEKARR